MIKTLCILNISAYTSQQSGLKLTAFWNLPKPRQDGSPFKLLELLHVISVTSRTPNKATLRSDILKWKPGLPPGMLWTCRWQRVFWGEGYRRWAKGLGGQRQTGLPQYHVISADVAVFCLVLDWKVKIWSIWILRISCSLRNQAHLPLQEPD